jgi:hypothetical protein
MYHRPLAYRLVTAGFDVCLVSSVTCARYREARYGSWDKNDPKDARVILEVMQQGMTMRYVDPLVAGWHDVQEVAKTYWQVTLMRTRVQHSLLTHFLPIYWPEFARYWRTSRSARFITMLHAYPTPASITAMSCDAFVEAAEARGQVLVDSLRASLPAVADWLEETLGDTLGFYLLKESEARRRLRTTNALEREHEEIRRRTRVIRIFPNEASYLRLASALAADRNDGWAKRRYIIPASPTINVKNVMRTTRAA